MARAKALDGDEPARTRKVIRNGQEIELPYCNGCGAEMDEIRLTSLCVWQPGFPYTRKFPLKFGAYFCESCRERQGFGPERFIAVPWSPEQSYLEAVRAHLAQISAVDGLASVEGSHVDSA